MIKPEFLLTSLVVVLVPGTGVVYTITTGLTLKWRASIAAAIGCTLGIVPHILASILGLSALLNMSAQVFSAIKWAGAAYLLYLAWGMWSEAGNLELTIKGYGRYQRFTNHYEGDCDQLAQPQVDDFLLRIPAAVCLRRFILSNHGNDLVECHIHGYHLNCVYAVRVIGKQCQCLFGEALQRS